MGLRLKALYAFDRARAFRPRRLWASAKRVGKIARRPALIIFADMLYCSVRYQCAFQDYQDWDFSLLTGAQRRTFMTHPKSDELVRSFNMHEKRFLLRDKVLFNEHFGEYVRREWLDLRVVSDAHLLKFLSARGNVMAKVPDSLGGAGVGIASWSVGDDLTTFRAALMDARQFLLEELIVQHPLLHELNPSSVNTLRVVTFVEESGVKILARVLKIGAGGAIDNFSAGGMYTMLSPEGTVLYPAFDSHDDVHAVHPISGVKLVGFQVPHFEEAIALAKQVAQSVPEVPYVGWDIAVREDGPLIVEGNYNTGVFQAKPRASGVYEGLLPLYRSVMGT